MERERNVVVTGGGTGIGLAVSRLLHERGWSVIGAGLEKDEAFPEEARFVECDVTDKEAVASLFSPLDRLSGLVTCAGVIRFDKEWDPEVFEQVMGVNVTSVLGCATAAREALGRGEGALVNIASMWSWFGNPVAPAYGTSKGAVAALTRSLAVAWGASGVRVNAVAPGWVETRISQGARQDAARKARIDARIPMGRWADTSEIAKVVAFLLSQDASYVNGAIIPVDGGFLAA
jgi:NAD(P)-dependent dehydrogenase (short-subunit alcohol dehydrogenase family)